MAFLNYALPPQEYTVKNALLWGNFCGHARKTCHGTWEKRIVHVFICVVEFTPIISQIASIFEMIIVKYCLVRFRESIQKIAKDQVEEAFKQTPKKGNDSPKSEISDIQPGEEVGEIENPCNPPVELPNVTPEDLGKLLTPTVSPATSDLSETPSTDSETPVPVNITAELQLEKARQERSKDACIIG